MCAAQPRRYCIACTRCLCSSTRKTGLVEALKRKAFLVHKYTKICRYGSDVAVYRLRRVEAAQPRRIRPRHGLQEKARNKAYANVLFTLMTHNLKFLKHSSRFLKGMACNFCKSRCYVREQSNSFSHHYLHGVAKRFRSSKQQELDWCHIAVLVLDIARPPFWLSERVPSDKLPFVTCSLFFLFV